MHNIVPEFIVKNYKAVFFDAFGVLKNRLALKQSTLFVNVLPSASNRGRPQRRHGNGPFHINMILL